MFKSKPVLLALLMLLCACSPNGHPADDARGMAAPAPVMAMKMAAPEAAAADVAPAPAAIAAEVRQRVIIRNASMTVLIKDAAAELKPLGEIAARYGGFVAQSGFSKGVGGSISGSVRLRVEAAHLDEALDAIRQRAIEVRELNISSDDVTGEVVDVEARLRNLRSAEAQLLSIMQQAKKTEDVMSVFGQLTQTRGEIEQGLGRLKVLRESAALSTVNLTLEADAASRPVEVAGWKPTGTVKRAIESLIAALQGLADVLIWSSIVLLPLAMILFWPLRALWRWSRQRRQRRA
jgi:hypothetical protein